MCLQGRFAPIMPASAFDLVGKAYGPCAEEEFTKGPGETRKGPALLPGPPFLDLWIAQKR